MDWVISRAAALSAASLCVAGGLGTTSAAATDYAPTARNIIPSGQYGAVPPPAAAPQQAQMYDGLTPKFDQVTNDDLFSFFKSEQLDPSVDGPLTPDPAPRAGVTIQRDKFNVPHITGVTADDVVWGAGWVVAKDRALLLEQARYNSRVAAIDAPGLSAIGLVTALAQFAPSKQTEDEVAKQAKVLTDQGAKGREVLHDIDTYIAGINDYLKASGSPAKPWTRNDVFALNALKGQFFGQGGGDEARRSTLLTGLQKELGDTKGRQAFDDLRQKDDPEASHSIDGSFPYGAASKSAGKGSLALTSFSATPAAKVARATARTANAVPEQQSNALLVSGSRSATGFPLMVAGPQIGYFYPGLTLEMNLQGPGINVRGATSAPLPGYILIGRGEDYAWSLTSAGADIIDQYAEELCGGSRTKYRYKGKCQSMKTFNAGTLTLGGKDQKLSFKTTVHGPVIGYGKVGDEEYAISRKRASYGRDVVDQLFYADLFRSRVNSPQSFIKAALQSPQTFNSFYVDHKNIALVTTGRLPVRKSSVDPALPTRGTGEYEWSGFLASSKHPQGINPSDGTIVNWNNRSAKKFTSADDEWMQGSIARNDLLKRGVASKPKHDLATLTSAMNAGATQDVRVMELQPTLSKLLRQSKAPSTRAQKMLDVLDQWRTNGGNRLDRNADGRIDDPGAAVMDGIWNRLADAAMKPVLGNQVNKLASLESRFQGPPSGQFGGWHEYMDKDLRRLLGEKVSGKFALKYCGKGDKAQCRKDLWKAIDTAGKSLSSRYGSADPTAWHANANAERITFAPGVLSTTMAYTNRPSGIQQVITFNGHR
ncbi:MAG: penicillin acylase family protein [Solirubrobacteraceae bacterium]|nr:penicillin acylase family protein [Solirubrobacteraceae bacterium]